MLQCQQIHQTEGIVFVKMSQMRALTDTPPGASPAQMRGLIDERLRAAGHDPSALYQELEMDPVRKEIAG